MVHFTLALAGKTVGVTAFFESTKEYCREYLCKEKADFSVSLTLEDIQREKEFFGKNAQQNALEPIALHRKIATKMLEFNIFLLHGSAVAVDGECFVFIAPSGTGKSTHTSFWRQKFGERAVMINDDKPFIKVTDHGAFVCGAPWNGKHHLSTPTEVKLKSICILKRAQTNFVEELTTAEALPAMLEQSHYINMQDFLPILDGLCRQVNFYRLHCTPDRTAADIAYEAMK